MKHGFRSEKGKRAEGAGDKGKGVGGAEKATSFSGGREVLKQ